jgi:nucleotide-binding universal stress UspA family protein
MKILLAYDGGEPAVHALERTAELAHRYGAEVAVVSVVPVRPGRSPMDPWDDEAVHAAQLTDARNRLVELGIEPNLIERFGDPAATIERLAQQDDYDMVVIGSRGLGAVTRFLQGSVSEHVATHTNATVVVAR